MNIIDVEDGEYFIPEAVEIVFTNLELSYRHDTNSYAFISYKDGKRVTKSLEEFALSIDKLKDKETIWVGAAYEVEGFFLFDVEPIKINSIGNGFNYGACNIIKVDKPGYILILAQND
jgi:hypothetical protein